MNEFLLDGTLYDELDGLIIVALHLRVRYSAVALCRGNVRMAEKVLDRGDVRICVQELRRHRVPQAVTRDLHLALPCIVFDPLLDAANGERCAGPRSLLHKKDSSGF